MTSNENKSIFLACLVRALRCHTYCEHGSVKKSASKSLLKIVYVRFTATRSTCLQLPQLLHAKCFCTFFSLLSPVCFQVQPPLPPHCASGDWVHLVPLAHQSKYKNWDKAQTQPADSASWVCCNSLCLVGVLSSDAGLCFSCYLSAAVTLLIS